MEIPEVGRKQKGILNKGDGRNFEIHGPHTNALGPQALKDVGRLLIKMDHLPVRKEIE